MSNNNEDGDKGAPPPRAPGRKPKRPMVRVFVWKLTKLGLLDGSAAGCVDTPMGKILIPEAEYLPTCRQKIESCPGVTIVVLVHVFLLLLAKLLSPAYASHSLYYPTTTK